MEVTRHQQHRGRVLDGSTVEYTCDGSEHNVESTQLDVNVIVDAVMHLI